MGRKPKSQIDHDLNLHPKSPASISSFDLDTIVAQSAYYFCQGMRPQEIVDEMQKIGVNISREDPYNFLKIAVRRGLISFNPPVDVILSEQIRQKYYYLRDVKITDAKRVEELSVQAALTLINLIREKFDYKERNNMPDKGAVHLAFSGGNTSKHVCRQLSKYLSEPIDRLTTEYQDDKIENEEKRKKKKIVFHNISTGFDNNQIGTDPITFFSYFDIEPIRSNISVEFLTLHAPSIVTKDLYVELNKCPSIEKLKKKMNEIDIFFGAAGELDDPHSMLQRYYTHSEDDKNQVENKNKPDMMDVLKNNDVVGDFLWLPMTRKNGPLSLDKLNEFTMSLINLREIQENIAKKNTYVLLVLSNCGACNRDRKEILKVILEQNPPMITHLVANKCNVYGLI